jgi:spore coat polysaccharide biosynthesis protein SpsF
MRAAAFVQARMGSTRLPGKSLMPVWGEMSLLELVLRRVSAARELVTVVLATSDQPGDDALVELAGRLGIRAHRGPELDALDRFVGALASHPADAVVRVTADNAFVDPGSIDELVRFFRRVQPCDYATNLRAESGLPDGAGVEIATADALRRAARDATRTDDREHVTSFMYAGPGDFSTASVPPPEPPWPFVRLDVDTAEDLERIRSLAERLPAQKAPLWDVPTIMRHIGETSAMRLTAR